MVADREQLAAAGTYFVRVMTTDPGNQAGNLGQSFENMFSIEVTGGGGGQIYGGGKMETYANVDSGAQTFYLAQISQVLGAGKTMEIDLFDPGDVGQNAWLQILSPDGSIANNFASFTWTADVECQLRPHEQRRNGHLHPDVRRFDRGRRPGRLHDV